MYGGCDSVLSECTICVRYNQCTFHHNLILVLRVARAVELGCIVLIVCLTSQDIFDEGSDVSFEIS